jgi:hypothetical protein
LRLPKPIYEALPYFLVGSGILFIVVGAKRYEYVPTLFVWPIGIFCFLGGLLIFTLRLIYRIKSKSDDND